MSTDETKSAVQEIAARADAKIQAYERSQQKVEPAEVAKIWGPMTFKCVLGEKGPARTQAEPQDVNVEPVNNEVGEDRGIMDAAETGAELLAYDMMNGV